MFCLSHFWSNIVFWNHCSDQFIRQTLYLVFFWGNMDLASYQLFPILSCPWDNLSLEPTVILTCWMAFQSSLLRRRPILATTGSSSSLARITSQRWSCPWLQDLEKWINIPGKGKICRTHWWATKTMRYCLPICFWAIRKLSWRTIPSPWSPCLTYQQNLWYGMTPAIARARRGHWKVLHLHLQTLVFWVHQKELAWSWKQCGDDWN